MIGETVEHPQYGRGKLLELYRNGREWLVRFESGLRFRRPRQEFNGQEVVVAPAAVLMPAMAAEPMSRTQYEARQLVEALRVGVAPAQHVRELTIGLEAERASLNTGLNQAHQKGGAVRAVIGEYGFGKSHMVELAAQEALARNFLVATVSLDLQELPPHRAFDIYSGLVANLRYPGDESERGLGRLLEESVNTNRPLQELLQLAPVEGDPLVVALAALSKASSTRQRKAWQDWLVSGRRTTLMNKAMPGGVKFPSLYRIGDNARQMSYLLTELSALARLANYSGLCVLIDEAESYSLLQRYQRPKANSFFKALIHAAAGEQVGRVTADSLPQHRWRDYPVAFGGGQSFFFLFTLTRSDNRLPLEEWLEPEQILELEPHYTPQEIGAFLKRVEEYHAQAYGYEAGERQGQVRRGAAEHLAVGSRGGRLSIRSLVRLTVELYDLLYLYPDYEAAGLLDELRQQMRG